MVLQEKPLEKADFIVKKTGPVMVRAGQFWQMEAPLVNITIILAGVVLS